MGQLYRNVKSKVIHKGQYLAFWGVFSLENKVIFIMGYREKIAGKRYRLNILTGCGRFKVYKKELYYRRRRLE